MKPEIEYHIPVMADIAVEYLINPAFKNHIIADCTLGGGGYSEKICEILKNNFRIFCIDKDINAFEFSKKKLEKYHKYLTFINANFIKLKEIISEENTGLLTGIVLDLGLSSYQLTNEDGFSFKRDTTLDMRADKQSGLTAAIVLNEYSVKELEDIFFQYGEINNAGRLAKAIKNNGKIISTFDLISAIKKEYGFKKDVPVKFLSKIFQALRIEVNDELNNLKKLLNDSPDLLVEGGRMVVVSYHSLEDRMVKEFFKNTIKDNKKFKILTKKVVMPEYSEVKKNKKSRSAKLRCGELAIV